MKGIRTGFLLLCGLGLATTASAQDMGGHGAARATPYDDDGMYQNTFSVGAGVLGFLGDDLRVEEPTAIAWSLRYEWTPVETLSWELNYTGATDAVTMVDGDLATTVTLLEAGFKLNVAPDAAVYPVLGAGVGYGAFAGFQEDPGTLVVPLTAGLEAGLDNLVLATRVTYRPAFLDEEFGSGFGADSWAWTADLGTRF